MQRAAHPQILLPARPVLVAGLRRAAWMTPDGEIESLDLAEAGRRAEEEPPLLCHARESSRRLGGSRLKAFDLLELFAFVRPAVFCAPTPRGLCDAMGLPPAAGLEEQAPRLAQAGELLLREMAARGGEKDPQARQLAFTLMQAGWPWAEAVLRALGPTAGERAPKPGEGFQIWRGLPEWQDRPPEVPPGSFPITPEETRVRLAALLDADSEARPQQADYAEEVTAAFQPREKVGEPRVVLAEAGTGVGKTLGYIAPASLWAERNEAPVWLSTFTRNLQHQIDAELERLFPERGEREERVVIRKGRENYLCLLNLEQAVRALPVNPANALPLALMARWAAATRDGDMVGGDFPAWLGMLAGGERTLALTDRRGECIYSACDHYRKCFVERSIRRARHADLVIANHALVMIQAALGGGEEGTLPLRYVFDEGHHLFDAADGAFAAHLSGLETHDLRRWLLGSEAGSTRASRQRGLKRRLEDLIGGDTALETALEAALRAGRCLPAEGWQTRLREGRPEGPAEAFLYRVREQVYARAARPNDPYSLECPLHPLAEGLLEQARELAEALRGLAKPLGELNRLLTQRLDDAAGELESDERRRIEALARGLERRALLPLAAWRDMLANLEEETPDSFVDWFAVERIDGRDFDSGFYRHHLDPTQPFAEAVLRPAHGAVITSATLTDRDEDGGVDWLAAELRSGALHLPNEAVHARVPSPFDYGAQTKVFIVNDLARDDLAQVTAAFRELFLAAGGGALGLFTAIQRLRRVHQGLAGALEEAGLPLYAQHVDGLDTSTLVEIFRAEESSCLLGTDAVRDGVDVPGRALRLIVFDRVPWPRPSLLHKARRGRFGGARYDDMLTRLKLRQAFGRLIRRADDHGVFVLLDSRMPSRLLGAFPQEVEIRRVGLAEAVAETSGFLQPTPR